MQLDAIQLPLQSQSRTCLGGRMRTSVSLSKSVFNESLWSLTYTNHKSDQVLNPPSEVFRVKTPSRSESSSVASLTEKNSTDLYAMSTVFFFISALEVMLSVSE